MSTPSYYSSHASVFGCKDFAAHSAKLIRLWGSPNIVGTEEVVTLHCIESKTIPSYNKDVVERSIYDVSSGGGKPCLWCEEDVASRSIKSLNLIWSTL